MHENVYQHNQAQPSAKRLYNSLGLWIFLYLTIISAGFYIIAADSSFEPEKRIKPQSKNVIKSSANPTYEPSKMIKK